MRFVYETCLEDESGSVRVSPTRHFLEQMVSKEVTYCSIKPVELQQQQASRISEIYQRVW